MPRTKGRTVVVVSYAEDWPLGLPDVETVDARTYLTSEEFADRKRMRVFNLCRSYRYQSVGYYVSLLAAARGHRPFPDVGAIVDLRYRTSLKVVTDDLDKTIQKSLATLQGDSFLLSIYFGRSLAKRHQSLATHLFNAFQAPLLRAEFVRDDGVWNLTSFRAIAANEVPDEHREAVVEAARRFFASAPRRPDRSPKHRFDMAILVDPEEPDPPSDEKALKRFERAADRIGFKTERIGRDDFGRLGEFDALFIRTTTAVNHYTYRFARRAEAEGLSVIDDPTSILLCTNKVYLSELLRLNGINAPQATLLSRENLQRQVEALPLPCILKQPDGSFSRGVMRVDDRATLVQRAGELLESSELILAQSYLPTDFDWRVGLLNGEPLYVSRYFMARGHWQIVKRAAGKESFGRVETVAVDDAPKALVSTAVSAAALIGKGLYGVDLKESEGRYYVIEINDNPTIEAGYEDQVLRSGLYDCVMREFLRRVEARKTGSGL